MMYSTVAFFLSILPNPSAVANLLPWPIRELDVVHFLLLHWVNHDTPKVLCMDRVCKTKPFNWSDRHEWLSGPASWKWIAWRCPPGLEYVFILRSVLRTVLIAIVRIHCGKRNRERCIVITTVGTIVIRRIRNTYMQVIYRWQGSFVPIGEPYISTLDTGFSRHHHTPGYGVDRSLIFHVQSKNRRDTKNQEETKKKQEPEHRITNRYSVVCWDTLESVWFF